MKSFNLIFNIRARGKERPRKGKYGVMYTPKKTHDFEKYIRDEFIKQVGEQYKDYEGAIEIWMTAYYAPPKSLSQKKQSELIGKPYLKKPDNDNIEKIIMDALNGIAFKDDSQVFHNDTMKVYSTEDFISMSIYYKDL